MSGWIEKEAMQEALCGSGRESLWTSALAAREREIQLLRERNRLLQSQIDLLELRQEKQQRQIRSYEAEIEQLYQEKQVLEQMLQELPELYRRKLQARLQPIRERIAAMQAENRRLKRELYQLSYRLQHVDQLDAPGWKVQLPQIPPLRRRDPKALPAQERHLLPGPVSLLRDKGRSQNRGAPLGCLSIAQQERFRRGRACKATGELEKMAVAGKYEPLHLKYRPQRFAEVVGQGAVVQTLANAIRLGRVAPAYLLCGPRGTGKTSSARILAKSLNCEQGPTPDPCQVCSQCRAITAGSSLDVIEIDAASNTGVDNIRELIERAQFAPVNSRYKVYVIDECHMLSNAAFNALLKTLEEPPPRVVFVLATTDPQRVLPTIVSRCQRFDFRRIPLDDMVAHLGQIAAQEGIPIAPEALHLVAQLAQGGCGTPSACWISSACWRDPSPQKPYGTWWAGSRSGSFWI
jgi:DNA polymerase III delta' subunit